MPEFCFVFLQIIGGGAKNEKLQLKAVFNVKETKRMEHI